MHVQSSDTDDPEEVLFHMAQRELYESVAASGEACFPPIFEADGIFTHVTAVLTYHSSQPFLYWHKMGLDIPTAKLLCTL